MHTPFSLDALPCNGVDPTADHRAHVRALNARRQQYDEHVIRQTSDTCLERVRRLYPILCDR